MTVAVDPQALRSLALAAPDHWARLVRIAGELDEALARHRRRTDATLHVTSDAPVLARRAGTTLADLDTWAGRVGAAAKLADEGDGAGLAGVRVEAGALGDLVFGPHGPPSATDVTRLANDLHTLLADWDSDGSGEVATPDDAVRTLTRLEALRRLLDEVAWHAGTPAAASALLVALDEGTVRRLLLTVDDAGRLVGIAGQLGIGTDTGGPAGDRGQRLRHDLASPLTALLSQAARHDQDLVATAVQGASAVDVGRLLATPVAPSRDLLVVLAQAALRQPRPQVVPVAANMLDTDWLTGADGDALLPVLRALATDATAAARVLSDATSVPTLLRAADHRPAADLVGTIVASVRAHAEPDSQPTADHVALRNLVLTAGEFDGDLHGALRSPFATLVASNLDALGPDVSTGRWTADWDLHRATTLARATHQVAGQVQFDPDAAETLLRAVLGHVPTLVDAALLQVPSTAPAGLNLDPATAEIARVGAIAGIVIGGVVAASNDRDARRRQIDAMSYTVASVLSRTGPARVVPRALNRPARDVLAGAIAQAWASMDATAAADVPAPVATGDHLAWLVDEVVRAQATALWGADRADLVDDVATAVTAELRGELVEALVLTDRE